VDWDFPVSVLDVVLMGNLRPTRLVPASGACGTGMGSAVPQQGGGFRSSSGGQIGQLSGGQQQRVFLARALAQKAEIYFMDEPMAGVDGCYRADHL